MQRYKRYMNAKDTSGRYTYGKFVYGANGTLCQYARWRNEQISLIEQAALYRQAVSRNGGVHRCASAFDARSCVHHAGSTRVLSNLVFARMEG